MNKGCLQFKSTLLSFRSVFTGFFLNVDFEHFLFICKYFQFFLVAIVMGFASSTWLLVIFVEDIDFNPNLLICFIVQLVSFFLFFF